MLPDKRSPEEYISYCRVTTRFKTFKDFALESGKEYPIYEESIREGRDMLVIKIIIGIRF